LANSLFLGQKYLTFSSKRLWWSDHRPLGPWLVEAGAATTKIRASLVVLSNTSMGLAREIDEHPLACHMHLAQRRLQPSNPGPLEVTEPK
jgi:hypothetical protein